MKILHILPSLVTGGGEKFTVDLCNELSINNEVVLCLLYKPTEEMFLRKLVSDKVKVIELNKKKGLDLSLISALKRVIKDESPDVINTHLRALVYSWVGQVFSRKASFHTIHNVAEKESGSLIRKLYFLLFNLFGIHPISISSKVLSSVKSCYGLRHEVCVENGVESPKTTKSLLEVRSEVDGYRITKNTKVFLNIGRLCDQKNQVMLLEAFNRLIDNDRDVVLLVIGNDETESNEYLRKLKAMSNNERVHLLGLKSNVSDYLSCADVFCLSSLYEGLPITLLEAMAMKIIILSTPVGGIPDVIENNISGLLSAEVSLDSFYEKIEYCLSLGEAEVEDIILESKKLFKEKYAINITSERYLAEYKRLTNS